MPGLFVKCPACERKKAKSDPHDVCIVCLPEDHGPEECVICQQLSARTLRDRLKIRLAGLEDRRQRAAGGSGQPGRDPSASAEAPGGLPGGRKSSQRSHSPSTSKASTAASRGMTTACSPSPRGSGSRRRDDSTAKEKPTSKPPSTSSSSSTSRSSYRRRRRRDVHRRSPSKRHRRSPSRRHRRSSSRRHRRSSSRRHRRSTSRGSSTSGTSRRRRRSTPRADRPTSRGRRERSRKRGSTSRSRRSTPRMRGSTSRGRRSTPESRKRRSTPEKRRSASSRQRSASRSRSPSPKRRRGGSSPRSHATSSGRKRKRSPADGDGSPHPSPKGSPGSVYSEVYTPSRPGTPPPPPVPKEDPPPVPPLPAEDPVPPPVPPHGPAPRPVVPPPRSASLPSLPVPPKGTPKPKPREDPKSPREKPRKTPPRKPKERPRAGRSRSRSRRRSSTRSRHRHRRRESRSRTRSSGTRDYSPTLSGSPDTRVSPIDDLVAFQDVLLRGAAKLGITLTVPTPKTSVIFETLHQRHMSRPLLPLVPGLEEPAMALFLTPAVTRAAPSRLLKKYRAPDSDPAFLRAEPPPDSVIVTAARKQHSTTPTSTVPPDKESRWMDSAGRKICGTSATSMKAASATALLGRYDRALWDSLERFAEHLPREQREDFMEVLSEGMLVANQIISAAADSSLLAAHGFCHGINQRRHAWLRLTSLKPDAQQRVANLPFSGETLFGKHADDEMARMKAEAETLTAVGLEKPKETKKQYRPFQRRFGGQGRGRGQASGHSQQQQPFRKPFQKRQKGRGGQQSASAPKGQAGPRP